MQNTNLSSAVFDLQDKVVGGGGWRHVRQVCSVCRTGHHHTTEIPAQPWGSVQKQCGVVKPARAPSRKKTGTPGMHSHHQASVLTFLLSISPQGSWRWGTCFLITRVNYWLPLGRDTEEQALTDCGSEAQCAASAVNMRLFSLALPHQDFPLISLNVRN